MNLEVEHYFTPREVRDLLKISRSTLLRWTESGLIAGTYLPSGRHGKPEVRYSATAIHDALTERKPKPEKLKAAEKKKEYAEYLRLKKIYAEKAGLKENALR